MNHHPKTQVPTDLDLKRNPGIGQTTQGIDNAETTFEDEEADSTVEGDVMNETNASGGVDPDHRGHTNK